MPRFVVLAHHTTPFHYDLMLEHGGVLRTWSFDEPPGRDGQSCRAIQDHRIFYLDHEGEVSGGRGRVEQWDAGTFEGTIDADRVVVTLSGTKLQGGWTLARAGDAWDLRREGSV